MNERESAIFSEQSSWPAPAKLNLFLHVVGRRADGYHLLQSAFTLIDFGDTLKFRVRDDGEIRRMNEVAHVPADSDLVVRAARLLQSWTATTLGAEIWLTKRTPMGAGLGGGSSDAATTLIALNHLWKTGLSEQKLLEIGLELGADVPFFVFGRGAFAEGVGESLVEIEIPAWWYVVLTPPLAVPTTMVFAAPELTRDTPRLKMADFSAVGLAHRKDCHNDLQAVVLKAFPVVAAHLAALQGVSQKSIFGARMTGSGSSVFAAFAHEQDARDALAKLPPKLKGFVAQGLASHPLRNM
jgi:4-diphosphocytidyl-2-C-methyl-D-erythritol kinase